MQRVNAESECSWKLPENILESAIDSFESDDNIQAVASETFLTFGELRMNDRYNGWTNYETWLCALWIGEECETEYYEREAKRLLDNGDDTESVIDAVAGEISLSFAERAEEQLGTVGFLSDLLNAGLRTVDYREIARHIVDDAE